MAIKKLSQFYRQTFVIPLLCIFACASALAQSQSKQSLSHIEILKLKWEKQARLPRNFDPSVIPTGTVFSTMESRTGIPGSTQTPFGDEARQEAARRSAALGPVDIFPNAPARMPVFIATMFTPMARKRRFFLACWLERLSPPRAALKSVISVMGERCGRARRSMATSATNGWRPIRLAWTPSASAYGGRRT